MGRDTWDTPCLITGDAISFQSRHRRAVVARSPGSLTFREQHSPAPTAVHLIDCSSIPFEDAIPVCPVLVFSGHRNFAGPWWCATYCRYIAFESSCERDRLIGLDRESSVMGFSSQPFSIRWPTPLPQRSDVPNYFVRRADGTLDLLLAHLTGALPLPRPAPHLAGNRGHVDSDACYCSPDRVPLPSEGS